jgi:hypothetical protein
MCPGNGGAKRIPQGLPPVQLYDLEADIGETTNVYAQHPEVVEEMKALLTEIIRNGRSTPGPKQANTGPKIWKQLWWMTERDFD